MSINGLNNNQPAFTAKTKEGNDYDKTNAGKAVGGTLGGIALLKGLAVTATSHKIINDKFIKTVISEADEILLPEGKGAMVNSKSFNPTVLKKLKTFTKIGKGSYIAGGVIGSVIAGATLLGIGATVDKMINHHEAKKADKAAELA